MKLDDIIKPQAEVTRLLQRVMRSPIFLTVYLIIFVFTYLFSAGHVFGEGQSLQKFASFFGLGVLDYLVAYLVFGRVVHACLVRNVPMLLASIVFWLIVIMIEQGLGYLFLYDPTITIQEAAVVLIATGLLVVIACIGLVAIFHDEIAKSVSWLPENTPIWKPLKVYPDQILKQLAPENRGVVLRLQADGKTLNVVTDKGEQTLRMALKDALELVAQEAGLKVHRSLWIRNDQIQDLFHENGNPKIADVEGNIFAVSRSMTAEVQTVLQRRLRSD